jgi:hypothetical protein
MTENQKEFLKIFQNLKPEDKLPKNFLDELSDEAEDDLLDCLVKTLGLIEKDGKIDLGTDSDYDVKGDLQYAYLDSTGMIEFLYLFTKHLLPFVLKKQIKLESLELTLWVSNFIQGDNNLVNTELVIKSIFDELKKFLETSHLQSINIDFSFDEWLRDSDLPDFINDLIAKAWKEEITRLKSEAEKLATEALKVSKYLTSITFSYDEEAEKHPQLGEITTRNKELSVLQEDQNEAEQIVKKVHLNNDQAKPQIAHKETQDTESDSRIFEAEEVTNFGEILHTFEDQ